MTILVVGATGRLGEPVARRLLEDGFNVRILTRNADRARQRFGNEFEIVEGDASNVASLEKALTGCSGLHISISGDEEQTGTENIVKVAAKTSVERITYISGTNTFEKMPGLRRFKKSSMLKRPFGKVA